MKKLTATATALAILLLAGTAIGAAAQSDDAKAPSFFTGTAGDQYRAWDEVSETRPDGVVVNTGWSSTRWVTNDPRIDGLATVVGTELDYREGALDDSPTGLDGVIRAHRQRVENDAGAWEGTMDLIQLDDVDIDLKVGWLMGEGAYEGLMAYVVVDYADDVRIHGHITPEGPPSAPASVLE